MAYKHGVYTSETATTLTSTIEGTAGLIVAVGTAPVNMADDPTAAVNTPIIAYTLSEAKAALGYSDDFASYTLCEVMSACFSVVGISPVVFINVLDPSTNTASYSEDLDVSSNAATIETEGVLLDGLTVTYDDSTLTLDTDYTLEFNDDGGIDITLISGGAADGASSISVSGTKLDPSAITASDIVGSYDSDTGVETGLEVIRQVFPKLNLVPGILIAPRWSEDSGVSAALQAKCESINGIFNCTCIIDIDSSSDGATAYTGVADQKEAQAVTSEYCYAVWPYVKVDTAVYSGSSIAAAVTAYTDADNDDIPNMSPSNKSVDISSVCLADGETAVLLDIEQANTLNGEGIAAFLNFQGYRLWGNRTAAYPDNTDPKDAWYCIKRFLVWTANNFILTYFSKVDKPLNPRLRDAIIDSENIKGNSYVARGICARYELKYLASENSTEDLVNGKLYFHLYASPYPPAEEISTVIEYDAEAVSAALSA